jgi:RecB family endonuclease NucS
LIVIEVKKGDAELDDFNQLNRYGKQLRETPNFAHYTFTFILLSAAASERREGIKFRGYRLAGYR